MMMMKTLLASRPSWMIRERNRGRGGWDYSALPLPLLVLTPVLLRCCYEALLPTLPWNYQSLGHHLLAQDLKLPYGEI
jgi:hypothetical protein